MGLQNRFVYLASLLLLVLSMKAYALYPSFLQGEEWEVYISAVSTAKEPILKTASEEADTIGFIYNREKVLIVEDGWIKFGWKKIIYPLSGYIRENSLMSVEDERERDIKFDPLAIEEAKPEWTWEILTCANEYTFVKAQRSESSETVGLLQSNEKAILIKEQYNPQAIWVKSVYPINGYIKYLDAFKGINYPYLALGLSYGAKHIPYEKNLKNYFNPLGGYIEYSKTNGNLGIRLGYNYTESRLTTFYVTTDQIYLHLVYRFFYLFNDKLSLYALVGGNYWFSTFNNKKYEADNSYFKQEKDSGPGYAVGGGLIYCLGNFFIEAQYILFGSKQAEFGSKPVQGSFTNYSTLYPGSNHLEVILGYRFIL
jgi:hypothetical protein